MDFTLETNRYGNIDCTDKIPEGWKYTSLTKTQLKKIGVPFYEGVFGFDGYSRNRMKPILHNIIPVYFADREKEYQDELKAKKEEKDNRIRNTELTTPLIAECIYSVSKEAKRQRDIKEEHAANVYIYRDEMPGDQYCIQMAKARQTHLYDVKNKALKILIRQCSIEPSGYHVFGDGRSRDYYEIEGFGFHTNSNISQNKLGSIEENISAARKRSTPPDKAEKILERYISENRQLLKTEKKEKVR